MKNTKEPFNKMQTIKFTKNVIKNVINVLDTRYLSYGLHSINPIDKNINKLMIRAFPQNRDISIKNIKTPYLLCYLKILYG